MKVINFQCILSKVFLLYILFNSYVFKIGEIAMEDTGEN